MAAALLLALGIGHEPASALVGDTAGPAGLDGSLRTLAAGIDNYDFPPFFDDDAADALSQTLLRVTLAGHPTPYLAYEIHALESVSYTTANAGPGTTPFSLVAGDVRYRALDLTWDEVEKRSLRASLGLDRANVTLRLGRMDVTLGRQAITFGKTYFWNPLDVFLPFDPSQFDREYKPGVDAARLDFALGTFSGLNLVAAAGRVPALGSRAAEAGSGVADAGSGGPDAGSGAADTGGRLDASWFGSAVLARVFTTYTLWDGGWDLALQGGKVFGGYHVGGGAVGEAGPLEVRLEAAGFFAANRRPLLPGVFADSEKLVEDSAALVAGLGHRFESSLTVECEYFLNGAGDSGNLDASLVRFASGGILNMSEHLGGCMVSYEILPIVLGSLGGILAFDDLSGQIQPGITWSAADEIEVLAGAIVNLGERPNGVDALAPGLQSEFGTFPDLYYVEVKLYF